MYDFFLFLFFMIFITFSFNREGTGGVAGGRGHPDLTGSAKPGMTTADETYPCTFLKNSSRQGTGRGTPLGAPGRAPLAGKADLGFCPLQIPK